MKNIVSKLLYSRKFFIEGPPLNQACLRKIVPWLEFQRSYVHARTKLGSKANQGSIFLNLTCFKGVSSVKNSSVFISLSVTLVIFFLNIKYQIFIGIKVKIIEKSKPGHPEEKYYCVVPNENGMTKYFDFVMKVSNQTQIYKRTVVLDIFLFYPH